MRFAYWKDPLFLACFAIYWIHRWLAAHGMSAPLLQSHLNDLICIPFWTPVMLWLERRFRLRRHDGPPDAIEILVPLMILAVIFEVIIPLHPKWHIATVGDPKDVLAYCIGALVATLFWQWRYRERKLGV